MTIASSFASSAPVGSLRKVTAGPGLLPDGPCRGLLVGTAGTCTMRDGGDVLCTDVPLQLGWNPCGASRIISGSADNIWALY